MQRLLHSIDVAGFCAAVPANVESVADSRYESPESRRRFSAATGVLRRRICPPDLFFSDLAYAAATNLLGDLNWSREDIESLVVVTQSGDAAYPSTSCILQHRLLLSTECAAFDINLGCSGFPYGLYVVNAVQEEIGLRGAEMIARRIKPDVAIVTDVTHDTTTPMISKNIEGDVSTGKGPSLSYAPAVHNKLLGLVEEIAKNKKIPVQWRALSRSTGTDTDSFAYSNDGCPSVLISIPLRYMHTTVEMLHRDDIENTIKLMYETLLTLSPKTNLNYL